MRPTLKRDYFQSWVKGLEETHVDLLNQEISTRRSPRIEYIETYYISNPSNYSRKKIQDIGGLSQEEKDHVKEHIEFILYGAVKASTRTEFFLAGNMIRKRWVNTHTPMRVRLDPSTRSWLREFLSNREYDVG